MVLKTWQETPYCDPWFLDGIIVFLWLFKQVYINLFIHLLFPLQHHLAETRWHGIRIWMSIKFATSNWIVVSHLFCFGKLVVSGSCLVLHLLDNWSTVTEWKGSGAMSLAKWSAGVAPGWILGVHHKWATKQTIHPSFRTYCRNQNREIRSPQKWLKIKNCNNNTYRFRWQIVSPLLRRMAIQELWSQVVYLLLCTE